MVNKDYSNDLSIPSGIEVSVNGDSITVKGAKGQLERKFVSPRIKISKGDNLVLFKCKEGLKFCQNDKMLMNSFRAHIKNMFEGVTKGYSAKLKICSGHFPMNVTVEGNTLSVKNFLGEKVPRKARIAQGVKVQVQGDIILVNGLDKEKVGQTAATIEQTTRVSNRDRRIFQDGCFIISKPGDEDE